MWLLKLLVKHNCIIGNRCKKYNCTSTGYPLEYYHQQGYLYTFHLEKLDGDASAIRAFISDLKKDRAVSSLEINQQTLFFIYKTRKTEELPVQLSLAAKKIFHTKPVFVDREGVEYWEIAAWKKEHLMDFIVYLKKNTKGLVLLKIQKIIKTKLDTLFFPSVMPQLTALQRKALDLAIAEGYYNYPRQIDLSQLAKIMKISLSTYREHLRKAEKAVLPKMQATMLNV